MCIRDSNRRIGELLTDKHNLFNQGDLFRGTFEGHRKQIAGLQEGLRKRIKNGKACGVVGAEAAAGASIPTRPSGIR